MNVRMAIIHSGFISTPSGAVGYKPDYSVNGALTLKGVLALGSPRLKTSVTSYYFFPANGAGQTERVAR